MIHKFNGYGDIITLDTKEKYVQINNNSKIPFTRMDELVQKAKGINRIHKPIALLIYTDWKNGKLNHYTDIEIKGVK